MRTRTTTTPVPWFRQSFHTLVDLSIRPGYTYSGPVLGSQIKFYQGYTTPTNMTGYGATITDTVGVRSLNPCTHTKSTLWISDAPVTYYKRYLAGSKEPPSGSTDPAWYRQRYVVDNPAGYPEDIGYNSTGIRYSPSGSGWPVVPLYSAQYSNDWEDVYSTAAVRDMAPRVKELMSLPNFLWELPEWRDLNGNLAKQLRHFRDKTPRLFRKLRYASMAVASLYLLKEFAIRPLLGDLSAIRRCMSHVQGEVARLRAFEGKISRSHWTTFVKGPSKEENSFYSTSGIPHLKRRVVSWDPLVYHATMYYRYKLGDFTKKHMPLLAALDTFGVNLSLQTVWDAIPFSFCVDWVLKFGDFLERYDRRAVSPQTEILGFVHSIKQARTIERFCTYEPLQSQPFEKNGEYLIARERSTTYIRRPYIPNIHGAGLIARSKFNTREFLLSASLLRTRFKT